MPALRIRFAQQEDASVLAGLHGASFIHERSWGAAELTDMLGIGGTTASLAEMGQAPAGFILYRVLSGEAEILTLAVAPAFRRQGVGRALVQKMLAHAQIGRRGEPVERVFLEVAEDNTPARALYETCGFAASARRGAYYTRLDGTRCDALLLVRPAP